ncbi:sensor histidine kinase [Chitinophaga sancti]|uniref:sensor histidine kinase n=1 Tax=Chitinophaga sancti TaxID=1004 RepID=UPI002A75A7FA|nr:sensor histidine kinase [Chitinophaga sancti]WPQ62250.1 sensor histidine kinase [Chitinophaga sancti]
MAFLFVPLLLSPRPPEETQYISRPDIRDLIGNALMLLVFYLNYYWLIPVIYFKRRYALYLTGIVLAFIMIGVLPSLLTGHIPWQPSPVPPMRMPDANGMGPMSNGRSFPVQISHHIFLFAIVILTSVLLRIRHRWFLVETARYNDELMHLKGQISPHFLFNTLNSIYSLVLSKDDAAPDAIIELSELMRYVLRDANQHKVPLEREIKYITSYISLQQARLGNTAPIHSQVQVGTNDLQIAPLILISFIENAFKHGVNPDAPSDINIIIQLTAQQLVLHVTNRKVSKRQVDGEGIGMENTIKRLQLLYPSRHQLNITENEDEFSVQLSMDLA